MSIPSPLATKTPKLDPVPKPQSVGLDAADPSVSLPVGFYTRTGVKPTDFWWSPHPCCPSDGLGDKNAAWGQNLGPAKKSGPSDPACAIHWMMQQGVLKAHVHFPGGNSLNGQGLLGRLSEYRRDLVKMPKGREQEERWGLDLGSAVEGLCRPGSSPRDALRNDAPEGWEQLRRGAWGAPNPPRTDGWTDRHIPPAPCLQPAASPEDAQRLPQSSAATARAPAGLAPRLAAAVGGGQPSNPPQIPPKIKKKIKIK